MNLSLFVATPAFAGQVHAGYADSLVRLFRHLDKAGIPAVYRYEANNSLIPHARNELARHFLESKATHLLFADSDLMFGEMDVMRMLDAQCSVLGAVYPRKRMNWTALRQALRDDPTVSDETLEWVSADLRSFSMGPADVDLGKPFEVERVGAGLLLVARHVLERMREANRASSQAGTDAEFIFFHPGLTSEGRYMSEDYAFCDRWRSLGGTVHAAGWLDLRHFGTHAFSGNLNDTLARGLPL